jgi:hypothetical protein
VGNSKKFLPFFFNFFNHLENVPNHDHGNQLTCKYFVYIFKEEQRKNMLTPFYCFLGPGSSCCGEETGLFVVDIQISLFGKLVKCESRRQKIMPLSVTKFITEKAIHHNLLQKVNFVWENGCVFGTLYVLCYMTKEKQQIIHKTDLNI